MAMMVSVHVWFRPFRDELSLTRDDGRVAQKGKGQFRRKFRRNCKGNHRAVPARNSFLAVLALLKSSRAEMSRTGDKGSMMRLTQSLRRTKLCRSLPPSLILGERGSAAHVCGRYGLILRGRRRSPCRALPVNRRRRRAGFCERTKKTMTRYSLIVSHRNGTRSRSCKPAVGIGKLERVQLQVVQRLAVITTRSAQEPPPERAQVLPSRPQVLMTLLGDPSQMMQAELRHDAGNLIGHREHGSGEPRVLSRSRPGDEERIPHQLDGGLARKQAYRGELPAVPRSIVLRTLPPSRISELNVRKQKRTFARPAACRAIEAHPKVAVHPHHLRQHALAVFPRGLRRLRNEPLIEFVNELEARAAIPGRDRH